MSKDSWYASLGRKLHLDYHEPAWMTGIAEGMTEEYARKQARMFREAGVQSVSFFMHDHHGYCFFPTERGRPHPHLARDYVSTMTEALHAEGLKAVGYFCVFTNVFLKDLHPDWLVVRPDGVQPSGAWLQYEASYACPSSPYLEEYALPLLHEATSRYELDGIWLDGGAWLSSALCTCIFCQQQFREATGLDLPASSPHAPKHPWPITPTTSWSSGTASEQEGCGPKQWTTRDESGDDERWVTWRIWRRGQVQHYLNAVSETVHAVRPTLLLTDNSCGRWASPHVETSNGRFVRWLSPDELNLDFFSCDPVPMGGNHELILSREGRYQATIGRPFDFMNERFHQWGEWQLRSTTDFKLEFATILAVGGTCNFADQPYPDGTLEPAVYDALREGYDFVREREPFVLGSKVVPDVALLASGPSQLFGPLGNGRDAGRTLGPVGSLNTTSRTDRVAGAHLLLVEAGVHCLIYDEPTLRRELSQQSAVVIPEQCLLEDATIAALDQYVREGGRLLVTGRSGWWDEQYRWQGQGRLAHILGLEIVETLPSPISYTRLAPELRDLQGLPDMPLQLWGTAVRVQARTAQSLADLIGPRAEVWRDGIQDEEHWQHYTTFGACPPGQESVGPAITINHYGKGIAGFIAIDPFASYYRDGHSQVRDIVQGLLKLVLPPKERKISVEKPLHLEVALQHKDDVLTVHLLNYFAQKRQGMLVHNEQIPSVREVCIHVRRDHIPHSVTLEPGGKALQWSYTEHVVTVWMPEIEIHAMVVIR